MTIIVTRMLSDYLDQVCAHVTNKEAHEGIRLELESHLLDMIDEQRERGMQPEDAVRLAIQRTGDAAELGARYHNVHKPRMEWMLPALIACMLGIGLLTMFSIKQSGMYSQLSLFPRQLIYCTLGLALMVALALLDYRKLKRYSIHMHIGIMLAMAATLLFGTMMNGRHYLSFGPLPLVDVIGLSPPLLLIAAAGIISSNWWKGKPLLISALFVLPPCIMYVLHPSLPSLIIYICGTTAMLTYAYRSWKPVVSLLALAPVAVALLVTNHLYFTRLLTVFQAHRDPHGSGYLIMRSLELLREAGWLGHGLGAHTDKLPMVHSELLFSYIVYCFGWLGGAVVCMVAFLFLLRFASVWKRIGDLYGAAIALALLVVFLIQFAWSILMALGLLPLAGYSLPFMSSGGAVMTMQLASIGLVISICRRRHYHLFVI